MNIGPILFKDPMVRAILKKRKTQTRRVFRSIPVMDKFGASYSEDPFNDPECWGFEYYDKSSDSMDMQYLPVAARLKYDVGDLLYVREAWRTSAQLDNKSPSKITDDCLDAGYHDAWCPMRYLADDFLVNAYEMGCGGGVDGRFRQAMHMPRWASRITLKVTNVRVERLQQISIVDAINEGIEANGNAPGRQYWKDYGHGIQFDNALDSFRSLWDSINASPKPIYHRLKDGTKAIDHYISYPWAGEPRTETYRGRDHRIYPNPWVAAYTFESIFQNVDQIGGE